MLIVAQQARPGQSTHAECFYVNVNMPLSGSRAYDCLEAMSINQLVTEELQVICTWARIKLHDLLLGYI